MERRELRGRHGRPGDGDDEARPAFCIFARQAPEEMRERHGLGAADDGRDEKPVKKESDRPDPEPPEGGGADFLGEPADAERGRAPDDGAYERKRAEGRARGAARREKARERAVLRVPADSEPEKEREVADDEER